MSDFVVWILNCEFIRRECGFSINLKISLVSSSNKLILIMKISATNFWRFRYFADFDIKIVFWGHNSVEWISFCWVEYYVLYTYIETSRSFLIIVCSWLFFLDWRQRGPIGSVFLIIIGWLFGWLVGNAVFSETALRIFLIFCMKLGDYEGWKVAEPDFLKKFLIWRLTLKSSKNYPNWDFWPFSGLCIISFPWFCT